MECSTYLRNVQDLLSDGKTLYERRFGKPCKGPIIPFGSLVEYYPISAKDQSRIHQFGKKVLPRLFFGYALYAGGIWKGDILVADVEELETMDASEIYSKRLDAKELIFPKDTYEPPDENFITIGAEQFRCAEVLLLSASGRTTGIMMDSGDDALHTVPTYENKALPHAILHWGLAGCVLTVYLMKISSERGYSFTTTEEREIGRGVKEKLCFIAFDYDTELKSIAESSNKKQTRVLSDGNNISVGAECFRCQPSVIGKGASGIHVISFQRKQTALADVLKRASLSSIFSKRY